jgi:uncharacterized membrane protein YeaQ/YmgE (transglycosylase-associated protein family)
MKRYLIFAVVGPFLGGFWLLLTSTLTSGYWSQPISAAQVGKLLTVFATTLQYSYLFGFLPSLMIGAVDDILFHVKRIGPLLRMLLVGVVAFIAAELMYGSRGPDSGVFQFIMYGLVGFIPGVVASWLVHTFVEETPPAAASAEPKSTEPKSTEPKSTEPTARPPSEPTPSAA